MERKAVGVKKNLVKFKCKHNNITSVDLENYNLFLSSNTAEMSMNKRCSSNVFFKVSEVKLFSSKV